LLSLQSLLGEPNKYGILACLSCPNADDLCSASPLNNEAAQLHQQDPDAYQKKVLARHQDIDD